MFDDPKKELQKLEDQLLEAEINHKPAELNNEEFEELYDRILEEFGPRATLDGSAAATDDLPIRNFANGYGRTESSVPLGTDGDVILDDDEPAVPRKGIKGLVFLACVECLCIAAVAVYWVLNVL